MSNLKIVIKNLLANSLEGQIIKIRKHTDPNFNGMTGSILKESKQMLLIDTDKGQKWVSKIDGDFEFNLSDTKIIIEGKLLFGYPNNRKKRKMRSW